MFKQTSKKILILSAAFAFFTCAVLLPSQKTHAAFPGINGRIAFADINPFEGSGPLKDMNSDASDVQTLNNDYLFMGVRYSADGSKLAATAGADMGAIETGAVDIYTFDSDGSNEINVTSSHHGSFDGAANAAFNDDASRLAFNGFSVPEDGDIQEITSAQIYTVGAAGQGLDQITSTTENICDSYPVFSPDGNKIAFIRQDILEETSDIYVMNSDGTSQQLVTSVSDNWTSGFCRNAAPGGVISSGNEPGNTSLDWSPNGERLVFGTVDSVDNDPFITKTVRIVTTNLAGNTAVVKEYESTNEYSVSNNPPEDQPDPYVFTGVGHPQYTPDGKILYREVDHYSEYIYDEDIEQWGQDQEGAEGTLSLIIANADGTNPQTIFTESGIGQMGLISVSYSKLFPTMGAQSSPDDEEEPEDPGDDSGTGSTNTASLTDPVTGKPVLVTTPEGTDLTCSSTSKESELSKSDSDYVYPVGLVDFCFTTDKADNEVSLTFVTDLKPEQVTARKFNSNDQTYAEIANAVITETSVSGKHALKATYTITDNGTLDLDPAAGQIKDPVGLAITNALAAELGTTGESAFSKPVLATISVAALAGSIYLIKRRKSVHYTAR